MADDYESRLTGIWHRLTGMERSLFGSDGSPPQYMDPTPEQRKAMGQRVLLHEELPPGFTKLDFRFDDVPPPVVEPFKEPPNFDLDQIKTMMPGLFGEQPKPNPNPNVQPYPFKEVCFDVKTDPLFAKLRRALGFTEQGLRAEGAQSPLGGGSGASKEPDGIA